MTDRESDVLMRHLTKALGELKQMQLLRAQLSEAECIMRELLHPDHTVTNRKARGKAATYWDRYHR